MRESGASLSVRFEVRGGRIVADSVVYSESVKLEYVARRVTDHIAVRSSGGLARDLLSSMIDEGLNNSIIPLVRLRLL